MVAAAPPPSITAIGATADVVVFAKPDCGYCIRAMELLRARQRRSTRSTAAATTSAKGATFTLNEVDGTAGAMPQALKSSVKMPLLTYPVILIRGRYYVFVCLFVVKVSFM